MDNFNNQLKIICSDLKLNFNIFWFIEYADKNNEIPMKTFNVTSLSENYIIYTVIDNKIENNYYYLKKKLIPYLNKIINKYNFSYFIYKKNYEDNLFILAIDIYFLLDNSYDQKYK